MGRGIETTINGSQHELDVEHVQSVSAVVSDVSGQTIHRGCGSQGSCGSCTIIVKGKPRMSCTMRAKNIHNKVVTTTAGIPTDFKDKLESCLIQAGATQCGFCIPALTTQVYNLCAQIENPSDEHIRKALTLHSCRCMSPHIFVEAISSFIDNTPSGDGWIPDSEQSICEGYPSLSTITTSDMLYARPIIGKSISADETLQESLVLAQEHPDTSIFNDPKLLGFIISKEEWRLDTIEKTIDVAPLDHRTPHNGCDILFSAADPAPMETEICTVINNVIHVNGLETLPKSVPSRFTVKQWITGGSFGHRTWNTHVAWALWLQEFFAAPVSVRMTMAQMLQIRSKKPYVGLTVDEEKHTITVDTESSPPLSRWRHDLTTHIQQLLSSPSLPKYDIELKSLPASTLPQQYSHTRILQVGACLLGLLWRQASDNQDYNEQLKWARQAEIQMRLPTNWMNTINRHHALLLSNPDRCIGWGLYTTEAYLSVLQSPLECRIVIESPTCIVVESPLVQTDGYTISMILHRVHTQSSVPLEHLNHRTLGAHPDPNKDPDIIRIHYLHAVDGCIQELKESLKTSTTEALVDRRFSSVQTETTIPANGCSVLVELDERGEVKSAHIGIDCGQTHSITQMRSILSGRWMRALGREQLWDRHGNRSTLFKDLRTLKAKDGVNLHIDLDQSDCMPLPLCTIDGASTAAMMDARSKMGLSTRHFPFVKN